MIARKDFTQETAQKGKFCSSRTEKLPESHFTVYSDREVLRAVEFF